MLKAEKVVLEKKLKAESELAQKQSAQAQVRSAEEAAELLMQDCDTLQKVRSNIWTLYWRWSEVTAL